MEGSNGTIPPDKKVLRLKRHNKSKELPSLAKGGKRKWKFLQFFFENI
jgi:hypothetical protein